MTHFINCYDSIQTQMSRLRISDNQDNDNNQEMYIFDIAKVKHIIESGISRTVLRDCLYQQTYSDNIYCFNGIDQSAELYTSYDIFCHIQINLNTHQLTLFSTLLKNHKSFHIYEKTQKQIINKFIIKTNSLLKYGSFRMDPRTGQLTLCLNSIFSNQQFNMFLLQQSKITKYIDEEIIKNKYYWRTHLPKILHLLNQLPALDYHNQVKLTKSRIKEMSMYMRNINQSLERISSYLHLQFPFMYSQHTFTGNKNVTPQQMTRMTDTIKIIKQKRKNFESNIQKTLKKLVQTYKDNPQQKITTNMKTFGHKFAKSRTEYFKEMQISEEEKKQLIGMLIPPVIRYPYGQPSNIISEIFIVSECDNIQWCTIDQGGFGRISKATLKFRFVQQNQMYNSQNTVTSASIGSKNDNNNGKVLTRTFARKQDSYENHSKVLHEKQILGKINPYSSPFVCKFYYSKQEQFEDQLFIEYCPQKSLSSFKHRTKQFLSISTKLLLLRYLAQSIKFLKDNNIQHLDIKPSNILISSNMIKLIDFGQAYHAQICPKNFKPGTSLPYAPPQSFLFEMYTASKTGYFDRLDIFSFGVIMHELLYDRYPIQYCKWNYQKLRTKYIDKNYEIVTVPEKYERIGYKGLNNWLVGLMLKCLDRDEKKRPCVQWIIIYINYCISLDQLLYL